MFVFASNSQITNRFFSFPMLADDEEDSFLRWTGTIIRHQHYYQKIEKSKDSKDGNSVREERQARWASKDWIGKMRARASQLGLSYHRSQIVNE